MRFPGKGAELKMGDGQPTEAFTKIAQIAQLGPFNFTQNTEDATDNDADEYAAVHVETTKDYGTFPFRGHYDPAETTHGDTEAGLLGRFAAGGIRNYQVVAVLAGVTYTFAFAASIQNLQPGPFNTDGKIEIAGEFKISGVVTLS